MANRTQLLQMRAPANLLPMRRKGGGVVRRMRGMSGLGADAGLVGFQWNTEAEKLATPVFASTPAAMYVLVSFAANGANPQVLPFSDRIAGAQAYSDLTENAATDRVYAAGYCKNADGTTDQCDEWFGHGISTFSSYFTKYKLKQYAPWIIGGALVIGAIYYSSKKKSPARRRRSSWRRRTTTVWR